MMTKQTAFGFLLGSAHCWNKYNYRNTDMDDFIDHLNETIDSYECIKLGRLSMTQLLTIMNNFTEGRIANITIKKNKYPVIKFESYDDKIVYINDCNKIDIINKEDKNELNDHYLQHKKPKLIIEDDDDLFASLVEDANNSSKYDEFKKKLRQKIEL